ncbi:transglutaminase TgpA family protein [Streptomyces sp. NPDC003697]
MSGRTRMALCAAAATLMTACALLPLVDRTTWILQAGLLLTVQAGVGAATRRGPLPRPLTVAAQVLVTVVLLTAVFARDRAYAGLVPGPDALGQLADLLREGADDVGQYAIPAPLSAGIRLMLVGGVLLIGLLVDMLAVTFRRAAPAGLPLLALYSVAAGLSDSDADWLWFLVAATGYLMLLLAEGRDRLAQWGRVFGAGPRSPGGPERGGPAAPLRTGRRIGVLALGLAALLPQVALPSMGGGLLNAAGEGVGPGSGGGGTISAVNPLVSLRDSLNIDEDRTVLTLRTDSQNASDLYLRIVSLDEFDGTTWKPSQRHIVGLPDPFPTPAGLGPDVDRTEISTTVATADWYAQDWLPMPYPPSGVRIKGSWRYEPVGMTLVGDHGQNTRGLTYRVKSLDVRPTAEQLATAPQAPEPLLREYTKVPASLPGGVAATAREVTDGAANPYERAVRLQDWFAVTGGFQYDTDVEVGSGPQAIERFLKDRRGFCVHYSFAMAAMARTLGIPARVAVGFAPGSMQADGTMTVGLKDAHAWPELYFEGVGWTRFEPTPTRGTMPSYTRPDAPGTTLPDPAAPSDEASAAPSAAPPADQSCPPQMKRLQECASGSPQVGLGGDGGGPRWYEVLAWTLGALAALALPLAPLLWRARTRAVRLGAHGHGADDAAVHTLAVWQEVTDTAWDHGIPPDESQTPRTAAARIVRLGHLDPPAAASVHRLADAVEQVLYAPHPRPTAGLAEEARRVAEGLRGGAGRGAALRARFAPRSSARLVWAISARWAALTARAAAARPTLRGRPMGRPSPGVPPGRRS